MLEIRLYRESDEAAVREICLRTGDNGRDATGIFADGDLLSDIYAIPYTRYEPELCFVAEDLESGRVVGYIVGASDSTAFAEWYLREWVPLVADRHAAAPASVDGVTDLDAESRMAWRLYHPEADPEVDAEYPAHLHINLVAEAQGKGGGRALMERYLAAARARGAEHVHLAVGLDNANARAFYARLGFTPIPVPGRELDPGLIGRSTAPDRQPSKDSA